MRVHVWYQKQLSGKIGVADDLRSLDDNSQMDDDMIDVIDEDVYTDR